MGNMGMSSPASSNGGGKGKTIGIVVAVVVLVLVGWMLFKGEGANTNDGGTVVTEVESSAIEPKAGEIVVEGKFGCTPLKSGATPTASECVLGLMGSDGKFYALDTSKVESMDSDINQESTLQVVGVLTPVDTDSEEAGIFKYDGVMAVRVMASK